MFCYKKAAEKNIKDDQDLFSSVKEIIDRVKESGDRALSFYSEKFGGAPMDSFRVSEEDIHMAYSGISQELRGAIEQAAYNIKNFALLQSDTIKPLLATETSRGIFLGHSIIPVDSCCCYVPGGSHPLFSTALMLVIPAKTAGVKRVCAAVPPMAGSRLPHPATLAALKIAGADEVYAVGGAQAVAAFAYGTDSIAPVAMIVGPGNKYVTEAKRQVYGKVGIDFVAGPSEVLVIADENADPAVIAADILAQSEHDVDAAGILITTSKEIAERVSAEVKGQLERLDTADIAAEAWEKNGIIMIADSLEDAAEAANEIAPEHLEINTADPDRLIPLLRNYGSLFIGEGSAEVFGDYVAGTNHTLPTMGAAKYTGGVSVMTFLKVCTFQRITPEGADLLAPIAEVMAENEGLFAHAVAARVRMKKRS
ncbi:MAG: histidinol dehydrogenase [Synergistetes bacterium HGW-Synergistetes-1]|nr:MAG: histidinol dehydrogenase [Synergistetes bacterium HGW-Synergistetes-1]